MAHHKVDRAGLWSSRRRQLIDDDAVTLFGPQGRLGKPDDADKVFRASLQLRHRRAGDDVLRRRIDVLPVLLGPAEYTHLHVDRGFCIVPDAKAGGRRGRFKIQKNGCDP
ncbi:hypothetical protein D3C78_1273840 [compost metagenome]